MPKRKRRSPTARRRAARKAAARERREERRDRKAAAAPRHRYPASNLRIDRELVQEMKRRAVEIIEAANATRCTSCGYIHASGCPCGFFTCGCRISEGCTCG